MNTETDDHTAVTKEELRSAILKHCKASSDQLKDLGLEMAEATNPTTDREALQECLTVLKRIQRDNLLCGVVNSETMEKLLNYHCMAVPCSLSPMQKGN